MWWRTLRHLDEWDACIFTVSLFLVVVGTMGLGVGPTVGAKAGMAAGVAGLVGRRLINPRLLDREVGPPPRPMSMFGVLLVALGIFGMLVTAVGLLLAFSMITEGGPNDEVPPLGLRIAVIGFPVASAGVAAGLIQLARRLRR